jgi:peptide/nickel transport system permease protein
LVAETGQSTDHSRHCYRYIVSRYILRRAVLSLFNLALVSIIVFAAFRLLPANAAGGALSANATEEQRQAFEHANGLDRPVVVQFLSWALGAARGDFGRSFRTNIPVAQEFSARWPITLEVVLLTFVMASIIGIGSGIAAAVNRNSPVDYIARTFAVAGLSVPSFLLLTCLLVFPARWWGYAPVFGAMNPLQDPLGNLLLMVPATFLLAIAVAAPLMRFTRTAMLDVLNEDYVRTARAKGLTNRAVLLRHAFRNGLMPVVTYSGVQLSWLLGGVIILEQIMGIPGLGQWTLGAIAAGDYPVIMAIALYSATLVMLIDLVLDVCHSVIDPRTRAAGTL